MAIVGLFITEQLQQYNLSVVKRTVTDASNNLINESIDPTTDILKQRWDIQRTLVNTTLPEGYEISVIDLNSGLIVASTNDNLLDKQSMEEMNVDVLLSAAENDIVDKTVIEKESYIARSEHMAFTHRQNLSSATNNEGYIIYGRASLENIDQMLNHAKRIFLHATLIALAVTILLGYALAISITVPINDLKDKAAKMSQGDFSQRARIQSHDEIGQLASTFNYLTERLNKTLLEISSEQDKLNTIIEHMEDGLIAIDEKGKIIHHNIAAEQLLGISMENKQYFDQIFLPMQNGLNFHTIVNANKDALSGKAPSINISVKDRILNASFAFFSDDTKTLKGYAVLFQDITEHEHLDNMRKEFVANVSHELKTPVTTIKSYSETLLSGALQEEELATSFVHVILKEADRMAALIRDLLQLSHIDFKKEKWNFSYTELNSLIEESVEKMKLYYEEKQQTVTVHLLETQLPIWADRTKLEQVITNLFSNAIKYTDACGHIEISLQKEKTNVIISIRDNGLGIPESDLEHIFERFYRVDKGRSRQQGGTGLGLSIAQNIIEHHNGTLWVKSVLHEGSTFYIKLPISPAEM